MWMRDLTGLAIGRVVVVPGGMELHLLQSDGYLEEGCRDGA